MGEKMKLICETCLSSDRRLLATSRIISILKEIQCEELNTKVICWECYSIIMKFHKFKIQAQNAKIALLDKFQNYKPLSKLLHSTKDNYDFEIEHSYDLDLNDTGEREKSETKVKNEMNYDPIEDVHSVNDYSDHENDVKKCTVFIDCLNNSKEEILPKDKISLTKHVSKKKSEQSFHERKMSKKKSEHQSFHEHKMSKKNSDHQPNQEQKLSESFTHDKIFLNRKLQKKKKEIDTIMLKEKFDIVMLTEEEMLASRKEKANHPNYKKIPYKCDTCVLGFTKKDNYDLHFTRKHNESVGAHSCAVCCVRFPTAGALHRHRAQHYVRYRCALCAYQTAAPHAAHHHARAQHARDAPHRIHCNQCTGVFRSSTELAEHTASEHVLRCKDCGEKFKGKHTLRAHRVRIHAVKREFACEVCRRTFLTGSRLESHLASHSQALASRLAYCAQCQVQYKSIQVYRSHVQNSANHAQNRYQCPECNKKFASKIYRTKHYNFYHLKKSQYKCETCDKLFISEWRLKNHRQKHHGLPRSRDHACDDCGNRFYTSSALRVHGATHAPRGLLCARCGATYRQPAALYSHERRAHPRPPAVRGPGHDACLAVKAPELCGPTLASM